MARYRVQFTTSAHAVMEVEADSPEQAREVADETFEPPFICAQCSGWGRENEPSLELGEVWEVDESPDGAWKVDG